MSAQSSSGEPAVKQPGQPVSTETAIFGGGCFWCLEAVFAEVSGVLEVQSGYCGGHVAEPTYPQVCSGDTGHAEVVRLRFDPAQISYETLLDILFTIHDPTTLNRQGNDVGTQYRSAIFATSAAQAEIARDKIAALDAGGSFASRIVTTVAAAPAFWPAESEHDDYFSRNPAQPYCQLVVAPKVMKFHQRFGHLLKAD
ncbi:MAG: peptide-methionine (S)-S-oxide reductase MsrA [Thauera sp.]|jgi:peptide-methionine (S)-S-oxide reductase|nr:peptide-methionine (S)-S-oxide reductase MsrA [Thauera sp.]